MTQMPATSGSSAICGAAVLVSAGAIRVHGADAEPFLNAQLSNSVPAAGEACCRLAAWCDAKGRTLAVFNVLRVAEESFLLMLSAELVPALIQRLRMFVLRARVEVSDASSETVQLGVFGNTATVLPHDIALPTEAGATIDAGECMVVRMAGDAPRYLVVGNTTLGQRLGDTETLAEAEWVLARIRAGQPTITTATQGEFVPQMLNLHWIGGIDFHKGCYPGQEVVARLQFRGTLKKRVYRAWVDAETVPGDSVYCADSCEGNVLQAAPAPDGGHELLAVVRVDSAAELLAVRGQPLQMLTLPYPMPD